MRALESGGLGSDPVFCHSPTLRLWASHFPLVLFSVVEGDGNSKFSKVPDT